MRMTRRGTMELIGGVAATATAAAMLGQAGPAMGQANGPAHDIGSESKTLFWTASVTPCDKNLNFDPGAYREILAFFKESGVQGVVVLGTSGEFASFSTAERKQITEVALKNSHGMNMIVGPGTSNFPETLELSRHAADNGADGLLVIPPFYFNEPPTSGLTRYYSMLFDQVQIPINLYHIPGTSEVSISVELLQNLYQYPHLAGIKDSSGNAEGYRTFVDSFPDLNMRSGTNSNLEYVLDNGMGAILADGNVFTRLSADVFEAFQAGQDYHAPLARLREAQRIMRAGGANSYGPMKYALSLQMGGAQTYQRPPNSDVTDAQKAAIRSALDEIKDLV